MQNYQLPDGKVLILRSCNSDMSAYGGFKWPVSGPVEAPTEWNSEWGPKPYDIKLGWSKDASCGAGLHGWLWAHGDFGLKSRDPKAKWLVVEVSEDDISDLGGKVKFGSGVVLLTGSFREAYDLVIKWYWLRKAAQKDTTGNSADASTTGESAHASTTGESAHASTTGESAHASTTGNYAHASTTGNYADASTTGYSAHASTTGESAHASTTGESAHASTTGNYADASTTGNSADASTTGESAHASTTGESAHASTTGESAHASTTGNYADASTTGESAHAVALGYRCKARCGENGALILSYWDGNRRRHVIGYAGENGIKANTWYQLNSSNELEEVKQ
ncbi:hypothetical protein [Chitinophaga sp. HK235]|uniref:hypothetical protein n=1 Tax=Chitinophaga sp. HK235 TaxID=2952571 RepID=UPI001BADA39A|nr:hypothetical protein [Chitinophaga sp. HK235]